MRFFKIYQLLPFGRVFLSMMKIASDLTVYSNLFSQDCAQYDKGPGNYCMHASSPAQIWSGAWLTG